MPELAPTLLGELADMPKRTRAYRRPVSVDEAARRIAHSILIHRAREIEWPISEYTQDAETTAAVVRLLEGKTGQKEEAGG